MKQQKKNVSIQPVNSARLLAGMTLVGLVALLMYNKAQTDIGSAFGVVYLSAAIVIFISVWVALEVKRSRKR